MIHSGYYYYSSIKGPSINSGYLYSKEGWLQKNDPHIILKILSKQFFENADMVYPKM
jgi:hypothetical protein